MTRKTRGERAGPRGLKRIAISGFKSIKELVDIEIKPLTVIAGANSSGKSSAMQVLLILKQTLESGYDPGALQINGNNVIFTNLNQIFNARAIKDMVINVSLEYDLHGSIAVSYKVKRSREIYISDFSFSTNSQNYTLRKQNRVTEQSILKRIPYLASYYNSFKGTDLHPKIAIVRDRCFLSTSLELRRAGSETIRTGFSLPQIEIEQAKDIISSIIHLPGLRGNPERNYPLTSSEGRYPGRFENYVAGIAWKWKNNNPEKIRKLVDNLKLLELTDRITVRKIEDAAIEIQVGSSMASRQMVSIADVGLGVSQILPILIALLAANPGQTIFIEQPEIHLHPKAQGKLAQIVMEASLQGINVVVETHSSNFLLALQTLIAKNEISNDSIALHWFSKNNQGFTQVESARVSPDGSFGDWPEDFDDTLAFQQEEFINAAEQRLLQR